MKSTIRPLFVSILALGIALPAFAAKPLPERPPRQVVGGYEAVQLTPDLTSATAEGATRVWRHEIAVDGAAFVRAHVVNANLRPGDELILRSRTGKVVERIEGRGPKDMGTFWALSAFGDRLDLEFRFGRAYDWTPFWIDKVAVGDPAMLESSLGTTFRGPVDAGGPDDPESICSPADFEDVICYESDADKWDNIFASVGLSNVGGSPGSLWCSGSNVDSNGRVLTNDHCVANQTECNSTEFVFKYYNTSCGAGPVTGDWEAIRCDQLLVDSPFISCDQGLNDLDFSLHSVLSDTSAYGHVTPDPVPITDGEGIYIVQHPAGRPHEITHGTGADVDADGTVLRYYDTLDTEGGSSGSPIFRESDDLLIGLHHCGGCSTPGVGNRGMLMSDIYPAIQPFLCDPTLTLAEDGFQDVAEVSGNGDSVVDPGETWEFLPIVRNSACADDGLGVTATIELGAGSLPVILTGASAAFGTVAAGTAATSTSPVQFEVGATQCTGSVVLDLNDLDATNGGPFGDSPAFFEVAIGDNAPSVLLYEDFSSAESAWQLSQWASLSPQENFGLTVPFAMFDSNARELGESGPLTSPAVAATGYRELELQFTHDFRWFDGGARERGEVQVRSSATDGAWTSAAIFTDRDFNGIERVDLSAFRGDELQVRFVFTGGESEWWWAIDEIFLLASVPEGGPDCDIFDDGFESGDTAAWSTTVP